MLDNTSEVVSKYLSLNASDGNIPLAQAPREEGSGNLLFSACTITNSKYQPTNTLCLVNTLKLKGPST